MCQFEKKLEVVGFVFCNYNIINVNIKGVFFFSFEYIMLREFLKKTHFKSFLVTHFFVKISSG